MRRSGWTAGWRAAWAAGWQRGAALGGVAIGLATLPACDKPHTTGQLTRDVTPTEAIGLEVRLWTLNDESGGVGSGLVKYQQLAVGVAADERTRWMQNGVRLVAVPAAEVGTALERVLSAGPAQRVWVRPDGAWVEVAKGTAWARPLELPVDGVLQEFSPGRFRLDVRTWAAPEAADGTARMRAEIVVMFEPAPTRESQWRRALELAEGGGLPGDQARVVGALRTTVDLEPGVAVLLVAEAPGRVWSVRPEVPVVIEPAMERGAAGPPAPGEPAAAALRREMPKRGASAKNDSMRPDTEAGETGGEGPPVPVFMDVGHVLFTDIGPRGQPRAKLVIGLTPVGAREYRLLRGAE